MEASYYLIFDLYWI